MSTYSFEEPIRFHLIKVKGAVKTGADAYRAVLNHNGLSARATLEELAKDTNLPEHLLRYYGTSILNSLIANTMKDGRSRNFEGFMTTRLDITGKFDRIDEPFDPKKHACVLSFMPGVNATDYHRKSEPVNETKPPRGRFDYITYPGGEKTFVKVGEVIEIHGHDLLLGNTSGYISMTSFDDRGENGYYSRITASPNTDKYDAKLLYNSPTLIRAAWPETWTLERLKDQETVRFHFLDASGKGRHDSYSNMVTILK